MLQIKLSITILLKLLSKTKKEKRKPKMAIIRFTAADAMQTTVIPAGIYPSVITKIEGPKASSSGKSNSFFVDIQITEGPYKSKTRSVAFNTGTSSSSMLGDMQFVPYTTFLQVKAAITKSKIEVVDQELDTDTLIGQPMDVQWGNVTDNGVIMNNIINYYPSGYAAQAPAF